MRLEHLDLLRARESKLSVIADRIWYLPERDPIEADATFPGWDHPDVFSQINPLRVEYCSGNGCWIAAKAAAHPNYNWIAIERKFSRARKIWAKAKTMNLPNLFVICAEGHFVTSHYFSAGSVSDFFINFPDPWPKRRHARHRIIQPAFASQLSRTLIPEGSLTMVSDDAAYSEWTIRILNATPGFTSCYSAPFYVTDQEDYGCSYFEQLWRSKGKTIRYHKFKKTVLA